MDSLLLKVFNGYKKRHPNDGPSSSTEPDNDQQANIPVIVFERNLHVSSRVGIRDWALGCHWSAPILAKLIGKEKWSHIQEVGVDPNMTVADIGNLPPMKLLHGVTGEPLAEMGTDGEPLFRFLRSRLVALLADGVDVRYGKTLDRFTYDKADGSHEGIVTAYFIDGTEVRGRLLIGADGVKSRVRSLLFEHDPKQAALSRLPYAATFVNASFTADQARYIRAAQCHPFMCAIPHPKGLMNFLSVLDATQAEYPETWIFSFYVGYLCSIEEQNRKATPRERLQEAKRMVKENVIGDPLKSVYEWVGDDAESVYYTKVANWDPSLPEHKWENHEGHVTLAGDACHPMTFRKFWFSHPTAFMKAYR